MYVTKLSSNITAQCVISLMLTRITAGALCPLHTYWSLVALGRSRKYATEIAASRLLKSRFEVELNSTGSDRVVLALATCSDLVASLSWSRHTRMGTFEENTSQYVTKMTSVSDQNR